MQIANNYRHSANDWSEDFGSRGAGVVICEQCHNAFIGARRRKICRRCHEEREEARRAKERSKLNEFALAKETAAESERIFRSLVSLHHAKPRKIAWSEVAGELAPPPPYDLNVHARSDWRNSRLADPKVTPSRAPEGKSSDTAQSAHEELVRRFQVAHALAKRVLVGDASAYPEALETHGSFADLLNLGIGIDVTFNSPQRLLIELACASEKVIPYTAHTVTSTGKLSEKNLPRTQHQEIYQDHVCSAMLRVARECFAVLPIDFLLLNCRAEIGAKTGAEKKFAPIYSVLMHRQRFEALDFEGVDPSDAISGFSHRGDFKASRKAGAFSAVEPLAFDETPAGDHEKCTLAELRAQAAAVRVRLQEFQHSNDS